MNKEDNYFLGIILWFVMYFVVCYFFNIKVTQTGIFMIVIISGFWFLIKTIREYEEEK